MTKRRHLHPVPDVEAAADVVSLTHAAQVLSDRHAKLTYQQQHARAAAAMPDVARERAALIAKLAYRLAKPHADTRALLEEFGVAMFITGYMDDAAEERDGLADATLGTIINFEGIEKRLRDEANLMLHPGGGDPA